MEQSDEYRKLQELIFTGEANNISLALTIARGMGGDLQAFYHAVQDAVAFYERVKKQLYTPQKLFKELIEKGMQLKNLELETLPDCLWVLSNFVTKADLSSNQFFELPRVLLKFQSLQSLNLSHNNIRQLPDTFWDMQQLEHLFLEDNFLMTLPERIELFQHLKSLSLTCRSDIFFPAAFKKLQKLQSLSLNFSKGRQVPDIIFELKGLEQLQLKGADMNVLSENIGKLSLLKQLTISSCGLESLAVSLLQLKELRVLELTNLPIFYQLPSLLFQLEDLEALNLENSPLSELSPRLRLLRKLKKINIKGCTNAPALMQQWQKRVRAWLPEAVVIC